MQELNLREGSRVRVKPSDACHSGVGAGLKAEVTSATWVTQIHGGLGQGGTWSTSQGARVPTEVTEG